MLTSIIIGLVVGGIIGWLASLIMRTDAQQGILLNIVVGVLGSLIAGILFRPSGAFRRISLFPDRRGHPPCDRQSGPQGNGPLVPVFEFAREARAVTFPATAYPLRNHCSSKVIATLTWSFCSPGSMLVRASFARACIAIGTGGE